MGKIDWVVCDDCYFLSPDDGCVLSDREYISCMSGIDGWCKTFDMVKCKRCDKVIWSKVFR